MKKNALGLRNVSIASLRVGSSCLLGPYRRATAASAKIAQITAKPKFENWAFTQKRMLLVDPLTTETHAMYLITRTM